MAKRWHKKSGSSLKKAAKDVAAAGRHGDTEIVHVNKAEMPIVDRALKRYGGSGSTNPKTGKREYYSAPGSAKAAAGTAHGRETDASARASGRADSTGGSKDNSQNVPTKATAPTPANDTLGASPESAAAALGSGGAQPLGDASNAPQKNMPSNVTGMDKPKPRGATPFNEGADALGVAGSASMLGAVGRAMIQGFGGEDPLSDHLGTQTGWSAERDHGVPGDVGGSGGAQGTPKGALPSDEAAPKPKPAKGDTAAPAPSGGAAAAAGGGTITVNPDGTVRTQDTSVAGLRAKRRYGATMKPKAA